MKQVLVFVLFTFVSVSVAGQTAPAEVRSNKLLPVLWQQHAAEYRALCYQAFNLAGWRLSASKLKKKNRYAIITDIDETVLDNSFNEASRILQGIPFNRQNWKQWTDRASATPVPGAVEFLTAAKKKGVSIFYVSNRDSSEVNSTMENLRRFNFPDADHEHMLFVTNTSSKEERRKKVDEKYEIIMLLGDNLNDFTAAFEKKNIDERFSETDRLRMDWGNKFIVLPNATYGEWENALYDYERNLDETRQQGKLVEKLKTLE